MNYKISQVLGAVAITVVLSITHINTRLIESRHALALIEAKRTEQAYTDSLRRKWSREHRHLTFYHLRQLSNRLRVLEEKKR